MKKKKPVIKFVVPAADRTYLLAKLLDEKRYIQWEQVVAWAICDDHIAWPVTTEGIEENEMAILRPDGKVEIAFDAVYDSLEEADKALAEALENA